MCRSLCALAECHRLCILHFQHRDVSPNMDFCNPHQNKQACFDIQHLLDIQVALVVELIQEKKQWTNLDSSSSCAEKISLTLIAAISIWISCETSYAIAYSLMISRCAFRIDSTLTWIYTFFVSTSECGWTVRIYKALIRSAMSVGVSNVVVLTDASGSVTLGSAHSIGATFFIEARVLAISVNACFIIPTF